MSYDFYYETQVIPSKSIDELNEWLYDNKGWEPFSINTYGNPDDVRLYTIVRRKVQVN